MTTLIAVYNSEGCEGRCDAKCYDACTCVCGGKNHGAGAKQATENTRQLAETWIDKYNAEHPEAKLEFEILPSGGVQLGLGL